ncbi:hypothetical protein VU07_02130 [Desulfobulbus sp. F4]|nr:hypothetical protein [Desulfobulbus sp. F4]
MGKIVLALCLLVNFIVPQTISAEELKWSGVLYIKGTGATNCGKARINNEAWDRCEAWAARSIKGNEKPTIKDVELYNIATEDDKGASWNSKLKCNFRASVKCGYRLEKISAKEKLKLSKGLKLKDSADESCSEPDSAHVPADDCDVAGQSKKTAPEIAKVLEKEKPSAVHELIGTPPPLLIKSEIQLALSNKELAAAKDKEDSGKEASKSGAASAVKARLKWSEQIRLKGTGITNCSESRITSEAWETCEAWAEEKKGLKGFSVKPEVKELDLFSIDVKTGKPTDKDPNPSCSFEAKVKCGYSSVTYVVEHSADTMPKKGGSKNDLHNLFGDGLRWSELIAIEGTGLSNCGTTRIHNEAWDKCAAWAEEQQKGRKQEGGLSPALKKVELYNVASENEKGPSWDPKQSCSFHATLKCGYRLE